MFNKLLSTISLCVLMLSSAVSAQDLDPEKSYLMLYSESNTPAEYLVSFNGQNRVLTVDSVGEDGQAFYFGPEDLDVRKDNEIKIKSVKFQKSGIDYKLSFKDNKTCQFKTTEKSDDISPFIYTVSIGTFGCTNLNVRINNP